LAAIAQCAVPNARRRQAKGEHLLEEIIITRTKELRDHQGQKPFVGQLVFGRYFAHRGGTLTQAAGEWIIDSAGVIIDEIDDFKTALRPDGYWWR
jgi:hypothetical protein